MNMFYGIIVSLAILLVPVGMMYSMNKEKPKKRKRARKKDGTFRGDDKSTPNVNEAWENE